MMRPSETAREAVYAWSRVLGTAGAEHGTGMVKTIDGQRSRPAPTPRPSEGMVVNGQPKPTLGLDHLGGWGRLGATIGIAVAVPTVPTLVYGALYFTASLFLPETARAAERYFLGPILAAIGLGVGGRIAWGVALAVRDTGRWIREGFEVDAKRRAMRESGTPGPRTRSAA